jgi:two-component sensor histidine kinase
VASLTRLAQERTDLTDADVDRLLALVADWTVLADLAMADLVLWLPTWNQSGFVAGAQVRPTTAPTEVPDDVVGSYAPRGRRPELERAAALGRVVRTRDPLRPLLPVGVEAIPVRHGDRVVAVVARHSGVAFRVFGRLEQVYLETADDLTQMLAEGTYPGPPGMSATGEQPRVGDGLILLTTDGTVTFASPNALSAFRRLGLATDLTGADLGRTAVRLSHRPGPVDEALALVAGGRAPGEAEVENTAAAVALRGLPLRHGGRSRGALVLLRDVTELRRRERALLTKDATIREIHHRVKNNLQTVAALLRLQGRRLTEPEARAALAEAERRVGSIALVHETLSREPGESVAFDDVADRVVGLVADLGGGRGGGAPALVRDGSFGSLPADLAMPLAMVVSELLQNAVEHSGASRVVLRARREANRLEVDVEDDGSGLPDGVTGESGGSLGLQIVRTLVTDELGGRLHLGPGPAGGTRAFVVCPLP